MTLLGVQKRKTPEHHYLNFKLCVLNWRNVIFIVQVSSFKSKIAWLGHFSKISNEKRLTKIIFVLVSKINNMHMPKKSRKEANEIKSKPLQKIV